MEPLRLGSRCGTDKFGQYKTLGIPGTMHAKRAFMASSVNRLSCSDIISEHTSCDCQPVRPSGPDCIWRGRGLITHAPRHNTTLLPFLTVKTSG